MDGRDDVRVVLLRGSLRAVLLAGFLVLIALATRLPLTSVVYASTISLPAAFVECRAMRLSARAIFIVLAPLWVATFVLIAFCHLQAVYAEGVVSKSSLSAGADAVSKELVCLAAAEDPRDGIPLWLVESPLASGLAVGIVWSTLVEPLRRRTWQRWSLFAVTLGVLAPLVAVTTLATLIALLVNHVPEAVPVALALSAAAAFLGVACACVVGIASTVVEVFVRV